MSNADPNSHHSSTWHWWSSLQEEDRAGRAELRRCGTLAEVAFTSAYHRLLKRLGSRLSRADERQLAALAAVLAHIETEPGGAESLARTMASPKGGSTEAGARVSEARFRQVIRCTDPEELMRDLIRVVRQLDRKADVDSLSRDLNRWTEETRLKWARDYFENAASPKTKAS